MKVIIRWLWRKHSWQYLHYLSNQLHISGSIRSQLSLS